MHTIRHIVLISLYVSVLLLAGCSTLNVRHLAPQPLRVQKTMFQNMTYWNFEYICSQEQDIYQIKGTASPHSDCLPEWGKWLSALQFTMYLCDLDGTVLAVKNIHIPPGPFSRNRSIPFVFDIPAALPVTSPVSVTFGYRMVLRPCAPLPPGENSQKTKQIQEFFANQGALRQ